MRWSHNPTLLSVVAVSLSVTAVHALPALLGQATTSIDASPSEVAGGPSRVATTLEKRQDAAASPTYNDGLYTPWTPPAESTAVASAAATVASAPSDSSVYLQPSVAESTQAIVSAVTTASAIPTTPPAVSITAEPITSTEEDSTSETVSVSTSISASSSLSSSSVTSTSSPTASRTTSSRSTRAALTPTVAGARETDGAITAGPNGPKMGVILPVALSLGVLGLLLAIVLLLAYRRRRNRQRRLNSRRYDDTSAEKGGFSYDGMPSEYGDDEKDPEHWKTFQRNSVPYDDIAAGAAAGMAGAGAGRAYYSKEEQDSNDRGWKWGAQNDATGQKIPRRPLPHTPQQSASATMPNTQSMSSLHQDLVAMIAESRTGYQPYSHGPPVARQNSVKNFANAIYSSVSRRSKRFGSRGSAKSNYSQKSGQWDEHGAWTTVDDDQSIYEEEHEPVARKKSKLLAEIGKADGATNKPLLSVQDDTPRKGGYSTYTPPDTPSRADTPRRYNSVAGEDTDMADAGGSPAASMQYSYSDNSQQVAQAKRYNLRDNPMPTLSPGVVPNRTRSSRSRSKTLSAESEPYDSPSCYSPSVFTHAGGHSPAPTFPDSLQPGRSPALGSRPVSPAMPSSQHALAQSTKSGTTYSLSGMAGLLYNHEAMIANQSAQAREDNSYTALPPRKPRKQSVLAKQHPARSTKSPLSTEASADDHEPNPHRAVSAVVKASRARGDSRGSDGSVWNHQVRGQLRESHSSSSSVDDLLTNILGPARSPA